MNDFNDERRYAWRMIRAARLAQAAGMQTNGSVLSHPETIELLDQALDAGLDRAEIIVELADLGARLFALCSPDDAAAAFDTDTDLEAEPAEICLT